MLELRGDRGIPPLPPPTAVVSPCTLQWAALRRLGVVPTIFSDSANDVHLTDHCCNLRPRLQNKMHTISMTMTVIYLFKLIKQ